MADRGQQQDASDHTLQAWVGCEVVHISNLPSIVINNVVSISNLLMQEITHKDWKPGKVVNDLQMKYKKKFVRFKLRYNAFELSVPYALKHGHYKLPFVS